MYIYIYVFVCICMYIYTYMYVLKGEIVGINILDVLLMSYIWLFLELPYFLMECFLFEVLVSL